MQRINLHNAALLEPEQAVTYDDLIAEQDRWLEAQLLEDEYWEWTACRPFDWEEAL